MMFRVVIVEDDAIAAKYLRAIIGKCASFQVVDVLSTPEKLWVTLDKKRVDAVCMDIMIHGEALGIVAAERMRHLYPDVALIYLTAYADETTMEEAAYTKPFAYLLKPYREASILATLRMLRAQLEEREASAPIELIGGYRYDMFHRMLYYGDEPVALSRREKDLITLLASSPRNIVSVETLCDTLEISNDALRSLVYRIRKQTTPQLIENVKTTGYKIVTA